MIVMEIKNLLMKIIMYVWQYNQLIHTAITIIKEFIGAKIAVISA